MEPRCFFLTQTTYWKTSSLYLLGFVDEAAPKSRSKKHVQHKNNLRNGRKDNNRIQLISQDRLLDPSQFIAQVFQSEDKRSRIFRKLENVDWWVKQINKVTSLRLAFTCKSISTTILHNMAISESPNSASNTSRTRFSALTYWNHIVLDYIYKTDVEAGLTA